MSKKNPLGSKKLLYVLFFFYLFLSVLIILRNPQSNVFDDISVSCRTAGAPCSVICNDPANTPFSDECPGDGSFDSCEQWGIEACATIGADPQTLNVNNESDNTDSLTECPSVNVEFRVEGVTGWVSGSEISSRTLNQGFDLSINCFANNGTSLLSDGQLSLTRNSNSVTFGGNELRNINIGATGTYTATCNLSSGTTCDSDSFTINEFSSNTSNSDSSSNANNDSTENNSNGNTNGASNFGDFCNTEILGTTDTTFWTQGENDFISSSEITQLNSACSSNRCIGCAQNSQISWTCAPTDVPPTNYCTTLADDNQNVSEVYETLEDDTQDTLRNLETNEGILCGPMDVNFDRMIEFEDFIEFAATFGLFSKNVIESCSNSFSTEQYCGTRDFNEDGTVDATDFFELVERYNVEDCRNV